MCGHLHLQVSQDYLVSHVPILEALLHQALLVAKDYFCASGDDPEFTSDGQNPLLFCKDLGESTTDDLELQLCTSTVTNEMVGFDKIDIYIQ